jgi:hypothetical protein
MSQENRPQQPNRPPQEPNQQGYPPQQLNQQDYLPQNYPIPPQSPTQYPHQAPVQQVLVTHKQHRNPVLSVLFVLMWPFARVFELARHIIGIIIEEMLRGVIRFIFGLIFIAVFFAMLAVFFVYLVAFVQVGFNFADAFPRMIEIITGLLPFV